MQRPASRTENRQYRDGPAVISIGPYQLTNRVILAPMAGVTDQPFRQLCRRLGAGLVVSEMVTSDTRLW
ncbi:MAG TPA: tRNA dihydrouridine synthase DusB, partial [Pseudomonas sp.]|nr:tRNA dihydrouridine synthase DusB [Pseudomonas sp.]